METENIKTIKFYDFITLLPYLEDECRESCIETLNDAEKPSYIFGTETPDNLNLISFGDYSDLCDSLSNEDHIKTIFEICNILYPDIDKQRIEEEPAYNVWGFVTWAIKEVGRINDAFSSIKVDYTDQERKAGIASLQFGTFGILDWYARRMGISDQNAVNNEKWVRIFQCMKNDAEETAYNRRLQKIYEQEAKRH